ncbi:MAG: GNAT family N-acetyltransferase [Candidatus Woesearchaeota archaeon]|nr:GNAT family N-acetyltransferase [Candidatus Woesearchaeota archaeon]
MDIQQQELPSGVRFFVEHDGTEVARAYLYVLKNDLHEEPFGFMEDVFVDESLRGQGMGTKIVNALIAEAKKRNCYKLIGCSRNSREKVHALYEKLGFTDYGKEFRMNF